MSIENAPDERLLHFYDNIRQQVELDRPLKHKLVGQNVRKYANKLHHELTRRRLQHSPINWLTHGEPANEDEITEM